MLCLVSMTDHSCTCTCITFHTVPTYSCTLYVRREFCSVAIALCFGRGVPTQHYTTLVPLLTSGNEQCVPSLDVTLPALGNQIPEEDLALVGGHDPLLILQEVLFSGWNEVEHLLSLCMATTHQHSTVRVYTHTCTCTCTVQYMYTVCLYVYIHVHVQCI